MQSASDAHRLSVLGAGQEQVVGSEVCSQVPVVPSSHDGVPTESQVHLCCDAFTLSVSMLRAGKKKLLPRSGVSK